MTDAPLQPDPLYSEPPICDRCMKCVKDCSVGAISAKETVKVTVAGRKLEWGKLDETACSSGYCGAEPHYNPFAPEDFDGETALKTPYGAGSLPYNKSSSNIFHLPGAVEGARGCIRACFIHLEEKGVLGNKFNQPFRKRKPWKL